MQYCKFLKSSQIAVLKEFLMFHSMCPCEETVLSFLVQNLVTELKCRLNDKYFYLCEYKLHIINKKKVSSFRRHKFHLFTFFLGFENFQLELGCVFGTPSKAC